MGTAADSGLLLPDAEEEEEEEEDPHGWLDDDDTGFMTRQHLEPGQHRSSEDHLQQHVQSSFEPSAIETYGSPPPISWPEKQWGDDLRQMSQRAQKQKFRTGANEDTFESLKAGNGNMEVVDFDSWTNEKSSS